MRGREDGAGERGRGREGIIIAMFVLPHALQHRGAGVIAGGASRREEGREGTHADCTLFFIKLT